ncbi:endonuclease III [Candidatus Wirthbacteria bacterium CG2_30_54_11]|uniref:Endonuclease III n=1 Tax=Candidatus Wirthbacteria bacterium CG2_30_54_11 TaxID=1817892 RepID=A0A1J5IL60_9BACT|nr:MAG: endonuclease III [Candidatus Wirthbacteria bacterium CG2_30_54_11]
MDQSARAREAHRRLLAAFPDARPALIYWSAFELLIAVVLSAQTTDMQVNRVTPELFKTYADAAALASAGQGTVERIIRPVGFFHQKAKTIIALARRLHEQFDDRIPDTMDALTTFPGVGRKSANIVLALVYGLNSGIAVDTHVGRIARRLGLTGKRSADKVEIDLKRLIPEEQWRSVNLTWVLHGRKTCRAKVPLCSVCTLRDICPGIGV